MMLDRNGTVKAWNYAAEELYGRDGEQVHNSSVRELFEIDQEFEEFMSELREGAVLRDRVCRIHHPEKDSMYVSFNTTMLFDGHHNMQGVLCLGRDVTAARMLEKRYQRFQTWMAPLVVLLVSAAPTAGLPSGTTVIGPPTAIVPSGQHGATGQIAPSPPGGSLFSRMFSSPASTTIQGVPPTSAFGVPSSGGPPFAPPTYGGSGLDTASVYGPPTAYSGPVAPAFPNSIYPSASPSVLFPSGLFEDGVLWSEGFASTLLN